MLYLNSKIISSDLAQISVEDRGFLIGDGLFETIACFGEKILQLTPHWERLTAGAHLLGIPFHRTRSEIESIILSLIQENRIHTGVIRITLTRGRGPRGISIGKIEPTLLITVNPYHPEETMTRLQTSTIKINPDSFLTKIKSTNYLDKIIARHHAKQNHFDDALLLNIHDRVVGASAANIFFIKKNVIFTPPCEEGALAGITRQAIIALAKAKRIKLNIAPVEVTFLKEIDTAFITNSLIGMRSVQAIDEKMLETEHTIISTLAERYADACSLE